MKFPYSLNRQPIQGYQPNIGIQYTGSNLLPDSFGVPSVYDYLNNLDGTRPPASMDFTPTTDLSIDGVDKGLMRKIKTSDANPQKGIAMTDKINTGVGLFNSAVGAISAYKALKLGKENLAFQKESFAKNFEAMKGTTNAELADRQARRVRYDAQNGMSNNMSVADYMAKYGVK